MIIWKVFGLIITIRRPLHSWLEASSLWTSGFSCRNWLLRQIGSSIHHILCNVHSHQTLAHLYFWMRNLLLLDRLPWNVKLSDLSHLVLLLSWLHCRAGHGGRCDTSRHPLILLGCRHALLACPWHGLYINDICIVNIKLILLLFVTRQVKLCSFTKDIQTTLKTWPSFRTPLVKMYKIKCIYHQFITNLI